MELKIRIEGEIAQQLRKRLELLGAAAHAPVEQRDTFFEHPSRDLVANDEAFRLREVGQRRELTYKGPRERGDAKVRPEYNVHVGDDPRSLLEALGFRPAAVLAKHRESWLVDDAEVSLDHVEGVGWFVEIEATTTDRPKQRIEGWRERLGLADQALIHESYLELALAAGAPSASRIS